MKDAHMCPRGMTRIDGKCSPLKAYSVQARQFGMTLDSDIVVASTRDTAIEKFKDKHYMHKGYAIYAQKLSVIENFERGDEVKIIRPFRGFSEYGLRKGSIGIVRKKSKFKGETAYQVDFPKAGKELSMFPYEIKKI